MPKYSRSRREEARRLYLTGEATTVAEIARRLDIKPHTIAEWKREEDWDQLVLKIERQAAEKLVDKLANERVNLNATHAKLWGVLISQVFEVLQQKRQLDIPTLKEIAAILEKAQRGQRLARGLSLDGQTEEQIKAQAEADGRSLIDAFMEAVKSEVTDEETRDRIARSLLDGCPAEAEESCGP